MDDDKINRLREVTAFTGLPRSSVYEGIDQGWFPPPDVKMGKTRVGWTGRTLKRFVQSCVVKRRDASEGA